MQPDFPAKAGHRALSVPGNIPDSALLSTPWRTVEPEGISRRDAQSEDRLQDPLHAQIPVPPPPSAALTRVLWLRSSAETTPSPHPEAPQETESRAKPSQTSDLSSGGSTHRGLLSLDSVEAAAKSRAFRRQ